MRLSCSLSLLALFLPELHAAIDWTLGYQSLDSEFHQIVRESELGATLADKLMRVHLLNGGETWLLIHIEVQSQHEAEFARRMFVFYYRILDRYNRGVVSIAVLGDESKAWRPSEYLTSCFGTEMRFRFAAVKLIDWEDTTKRQELEAGANPFASIVFAHLDSLRTKGNPAQRLQAKWGLIRRLYTHGWTPEQVRQLYRLIDWFLELLKPLEEQLRIDLYVYEEEKKMPYVSSIERLAKEEGWQVGRQAGRQEGLEEGRRKGLVESIERAVEVRFPEVGTALNERLRAVSEFQKLEEIQRAIFRGSNVEDIDKLLP